MTQLWLVPVDEQSYRETLAEPVDFSNRTDTPPKFPDEARVWGVRTDPEQGDWQRNRRNLVLMEHGDPLLFYRNNESKYTAFGRVGHFWHTEYVRDEHWSGGPALDVYSIEDWAEIDVERGVVNEALGYERSFWPQGLWRVANEKPISSLIGHLD